MTETPELQMGSGKPAVLLLSGGLDSVTLLANTVRNGWSVHALSFSYGQRHGNELELAARAAKRYGAREHKVVSIDLRAFGGSALTADIDVPAGTDETPDSEHVPITYVPARNTIFLSFALAWAEVLNAADIFIGVNALDYSGYPDCRPEFIAAYEALANLATAASAAKRVQIRVHAPLIHLTKREIVHLGSALGVDYSETTSCYDPDREGRACGRCDACMLRLRGFAQARLQDPAPYAPDAPENPGRRTSRVVNDSASERRQEHDHTGSRNSSDTPRSTPIPNEPSRQ